MATKTETKFLEFLKKGYNKKGVSASTQKSYLSILRNVRKGLNYKGTSLHFSKNIEDVEKLIENKSHSYKISTYSAIVKLLTDKKLKKLYEDKIKSVNEKKIEILKEGKYTDKERKSIGGLTFQDLENIIPLIRKELVDINETDSPKLYYTTYQYLILSLVYLKCKFLPRLDYCSIKVIYDEEELNETDNQLLVKEDNMTIYFRDYKNKKSLGEKKFVLCDDIKEEISDWLFYKNNEKDNNLFYNLNKKKPYNNKRFSELLKRMFLKYLSQPISCNHIRKLKEKHIQASPEYQKMGEAEREDLHLTIFHSKDTAHLHYRRT